MSSIWTPGGERPVSNEGAAGSGGTVPSGPGGTAQGASGEPSEEQMQAEMEELRLQLAETPAEAVVANHAIGLFELGALHLSLESPQLAQAQLAIDAMAALVNGLGPRLGEQEGHLREGLGQLQMAFVQVKTAIDAGIKPGDEPPTQP